MGQEAIPEARYRPLGLTIAILATALGYGVYPLLPVLLLIWALFTRRSIGVELVNTPGNWLTMGLGAVTLIVSVFAWIGRPRGVRAALLACVWLTTLIGALRFLESTTRQAAMFEQVGGNFTGISNICTVPILIFVPLYVTWYLNRAPARQFYGAGRDKTVERA